MWVDQNLTLSMYPDINVFLQVFANPGTHDETGACRVSFGSLLLREMGGPAVAPGWP